jgi:predicted nuclease with TOPRIM domain
MISLPYAFALSTLTMLVGGAIAWGVLHATVDQLKRMLDELREEQREARAESQTLCTEVAVLHATLEAGRERLLRIEEWRSHQERAQAERGSAERLAIRR